MKIALTFDDGPSEHTTRILNSLQLNGGRVSFFVMGNRVEEYRSKIFRATQMGSEVICHAWTHEHLIELPKKDIRRQIFNTKKAIAAVTGTVIPLFRPPYGEYDEKVEKVAKRFGLSMVCWSLDSKDYESRDADKIYTTIMNQAQDGDIVLCHDIYDTTAEAMSRVIPDLEARGFELVTVTELLRAKFGTLEPGKMYYE